MRRIVVKIGGALLSHPLDDLFEGLEELQRTSEVVLVHGGGPQANEMATRLGHVPVIVQGRRVTSDLDLSIVNWVIRGELNLKIVSGARSRGMRAVGLSGADAGLIQLQRRPEWEIKGERIDFGHVGDFIASDMTAVLALLQTGILPIICPPGADSAGNLLNINADTIALEVACALGVHELILVTETGAVLSGSGAPIRRLDRKAAARGIREGWIEGGMKVKTDIGFEALSRCVASVWIAGAAGIASKLGATQLTGNADE